MLRIMAVSNGSALAALREKMNGGHIRVTSPRHYGFGSPFRKSTFYLLRINGATRFNKQTEEDEIKWVIAKVSFTQSGCISPIILVDSLLTKPYQDHIYNQGALFTYSYPLPYQLYEGGYSKVMTIPLYSYELSDPHNAASKSTTLEHGK